MLYLTESDVVARLSPEEAYTAVEAVLHDLGQGLVDNQPRARVRLGEVTLNVMSASIPRLGWLGAKTYTTGPSGPQALFTLFNKQGTPVCMMEADELGRIRTAAVSAIATKHLAKPDSSVMALLGTGFQAYTQIIAIASAMKLREVRVWNRSLQKAADFCDKLQSHTEAVLRPVSDIREAVRSAQIVTTATSAAEPIFFGEWLEPGMHINAIGNNRGYEREIDAETVRAAAVIYVDSLTQAHTESGDLLLAERDGVSVWQRVHELSDLLMERTTGRTNSDQVTLFKSNGLALEDIAVADVVYKKISNV